MKNKYSDKERLGHIIDCIIFIDKALINVNFEEFENNFILNTAVCKWIELIGESAYKLTKNYKQKVNNVPWGQIEKLRHILVHDYFELNIGQIWSVVIENIPVLKTQIENLYNNFKIED